MLKLFLIIGLYIQCAISLMAQEDSVQHSEWPILNNLIHAQIVLNQLAEKNFAKGTEKYQIGTIGNMVVLMNDANNVKANTNALIQIMVQANKIIKPLGLGRIVRRNNRFEHEYGTE